MTSSTNDRVPHLRLQTKIAMIVITMSAFAFVVYVPVAYKHSQIILEKMLFSQSTFALEQFIKQEAPFQNPDEFKKITEPYTIGKNGYIILINKQGDILTPHPLGFKHIQEIVRWPDIVKHILDDPYSQTTSHYKNHDYIISRPIFTYDAVRVISVSRESDFTSQLTPLIFKSLIVFIVFGIVFAVLVSFFIRGVAEPIKRLANATRAMSRHKQFNPVVARTGDEIEILADEFAEMSRQINSYESSLEQKIKERTEQLSATNAELQEKTVVLEHVLEDVKKVDEELARLNHAKSEFISMASHQLRTPLTAIKWYGKILSNGGVKHLTPTQLRAYHQIISANERMIELVNALLNVSRIEMGTLAVEPQKIDVGKAITSALKDISPMIIVKEIQLSANNFPKIIANLDPKFFDIIINNLATNAARYTAKGGTIKIQLSSAGKYVIIKVSDTGVGIPKNEQNNIFSKFFRASNVVNDGSQGTGLGLYITKSIVEIMNGKISFTSRENKGTTFTISLPRSGLQSRQGAKGLIPIQ